MKTMTQELEFANKMVFQVEGITCMDCAQKFEKAVGELPGVTKASLNTMTGKLTVEGGRCGRPGGYSPVGPGGGLFGGAGSDQSEESHRIPGRGHYLHGLRPEV